MTLEALTTLVTREIDERDRITREAWLAARRGEKVDSAAVSRAVREASVLKRTYAQLTRRGPNE